MIGLKELSELNIILFSSFNERVNTAGTFSASRAFVEQPVFSAKHKRTNRVFTGVVVRG